MQNLLLTGGCGFIASHFFRYLLGRDDFAGRIINIDSLAYAGNPESLADRIDAFSDRHVFIRADICDCPQTAESFNN